MKRLFETILNVSNILYCKEKKNVMIMKKKKINIYYTYIFANCGLHI